MFAKINERLVSVRSVIETGERFKKLSKELAKKGADDPDALAAFIGRKKYGKVGFAKLARHEDVPPVTAEAASKGPSKADLRAMTVAQLKKILHANAGRGTATSKSADIANAAQIELQRRGKAESKTSASLKNVMRGPGMRRPAGVPADVDAGDPAAVAKHCAAATDVQLKRMAHGGSGIEHLKGAARAQALAVMKAAQAEQGKRAKSEAREHLSDEEYFTEKEAPKEPTERAMARMQDAFDRGGFNKMIRATEIRIDATKDEDKKHGILAAISRHIAMPKYSPQEKAALKKLIHKSMAAMSEVDVGQAFAPGRASFEPGY